MHLHIPIFHMTLASAQTKEFQRPKVHALYRSSGRKRTTSRRELALAPEALTIVHRPQGSCVQIHLALRLTSPGANVRERVKNNKP